MTRCLSCGSTNTHQSHHNRNEFSCGDCDSVFNSVMEKVYIESNFKKLCSSVASLIVENMSDANVGSSIRELIESYRNENPKDVKVLIERLVDIAEDLYNDYQLNRRDKYDFGALMEGITRLDEFANIQSPQDDLVDNEPTMVGATSEVPDVNTLPDPMDMLSGNENPIEVGEHTALDDLKNAISAVQVALSALDAAEKQEKSAGEIKTDLPVEATEGLQSVALDTPGFSMGSSEPVGDIPPVSVDPVGGEGAGHEASEQQALEQLKSSLAQLQDAYAKYINSETEVHPGDFGDKLNALAGVDSSVDSQTFFEKAKELMEDAQLVSNKWVKEDLEDSIKVSTQEIHAESTDKEGKVEEAREGENDIITQIIKKPLKENDPSTNLITDPGTESGEIADQPGEVDPIGPIHTDDINAGFSPENFFKESDVVVYENTKHIVESSEGRHVSIRNPKNGHVIEVLCEDIELANGEDVDIRGERLYESHNSLLAEWEKVEKAMANENLNAPKRTYDLRTKTPTEGF